MRRAREIDNDRIRELKRQINDQQYLQHAIDRLAQRLTRKLIEQSGEQQDGNRRPEQEQQW